MRYYFQIIRIVMIFNCKQLKAARLIASQDKSYHPSIPIKTWIGDQLEVECDNPLDMILNEIAVHPSTLNWIKKIKSYIDTQPRSSKPCDLIAAIIGNCGAGKSLIAQCVAKYVIRSKKMIRWNMNQNVPLSYDHILLALSRLMVQDSSTTLIIQDLDQLDEMIASLNNEEDRASFWKSFLQMISKRSGTISIIFTFQSTSNWHIRQLIKHDIFYHESLYVKVPSTYHRIEWLKHIAKSKNLPLHLQRSTLTRVKLDDVNRLIQLVTKSDRWHMIKDMSMHKWILAGVHAVRSNNDDMMNLMLGVQDDNGDLIPTMQRICGKHSCFEQFEKDIEHIGGRKVILQLMDQSRNIHLRDRINLLDDYLLMMNLPNMYISQYLYTCQKTSLYSIFENKYEWKPVNIYQKPKRVSRLDMSINLLTH